MKKIVLIGYQVGFVMLSFVLFTKCHSPGSQKNEVSLAQEQYRPQVHFTPDSMWMNDPNGMVYYEGEYHLFYQYYPDSTVWGPMHWGHATSTDLMHWNHEPIALYPDSLGWIFSGSAVADVHNTSGLGINGKGPLVAIFTYHNMKRERAGANDYQSQGIAYSNDKGRTWTKFAGNPVVKNPGIRDFRDPKVMWHEHSQKWIMTLAVKDHVEFYSSPNLIDWKKESEFGKENGSHKGVLECPDLIQMPVAGTTEKQWVLLLSINPGGPNGGSATQYFVGNFDGNRFTTEQTDTVWVDYGRDNYAGVTWSNIPEEDGRRIFLGWMSNWDYGQVVPTQKWRSAMTLPRELTLEKSNQTYRIVSEPVTELELLKAELLNKAPFNLNEDAPFREFEIPDSPIEIQLDVDITLNESATNGVLYFGFKNANDETFITGYDVHKKLYFTDRTKAGIDNFSDKFSSISYAPGDVPEKITLQIILDKSSVEIFYNQGETVFTELLFPSADYDKLTFGVENLSIDVNSLKIYRLNSIWDSE